MILIRLRSWKLKPKFERMLICSSCLSDNFLLRVGLDPRRWCEPFDHFERRPRQVSGWGGPNHLQIAEAAAQGIAEIRALMGWLLKEACPVALWGISMVGTMRDGLHPVTRDWPPPSSLCPALR